MIGDANKNISPSYSGWIDLFGWGTGDNPTKTSKNNSDYSIFNDWGNNLGNGWHTLTSEEWEYVFDIRKTTEGIRYAKATVNDITGVILLPDDWNSSICRLINTNKNDASFDSNTFTSLQWNTLEEHGAVFLPVVGYNRQEKWIDDYGEYGVYWTASPVENEYARCLEFFSEDIYAGGYDGWFRHRGLSVRLVCPTN